jgi:anti-sigma-K factor RskA
MSDASFPDLPDDPDAALAAEYVLRLLDPAEEAACAARIARDPAFEAEVERWQQQFAGLDAAFAPVAPPARLRADVEARLFGRPPSLAARLWRSAALWRGVAAAAVLAAAVFGYLARPVPDAGVPVAPELVATVAPAVGDVQLVALLDREAGLLRFTRLAGDPAPGRSLELWILPEGESVPASLGLVPAEPRFAVPIPAGVAPRVGQGTLILVSDEIEGGSPTGLPQGSVLASGAIAEL